jgi:hypothetical protein
MQDAAMKHFTGDLMQVHLATLTFIPKLDCCCLVGACVLRVVRLQAACCYTVMFPCCAFREVLCDMHDAGSPHVLCNSSGWQENV